MFISIDIFFARVIVCRRIPFVKEEETDMQPNVTGIVSSQARGTNIGRPGHGLFPHSREGDLLSRRGRALYGISYTLDMPHTPHRANKANKSNSVNTVYPITPSSKNEAGNEASGSAGSNSVNTVYEIAPSSKMPARSVAVSKIVYTEEADR